MIDSNLFNWDRSKCRLFFANAYDALVGVVAKEIRKGSDVNNAAKEFFEGYKEANKTPIILANSCAPNDRLKQILCQLESDIHLGILSSDITNIGTKYSHVIKGSPEGIEASNSFAREKIEQKVSDIEQALFHF